MNGYNLLRNFHLFGDVFYKADFSLLQKILKLFQTLVMGLAILL